MTAIASAPHNVQHDEELEAAAQYIERELQDIGYSIGRQQFSVDGSNVRNIEVQRDPNGSAATSTLVVGAHYDSYDNAPGANDNATGTAGVIELARLLKDWGDASTFARQIPEPHMSGLGQIRASRPQRMTVSLPSDR